MTGIEEFTQSLEATERENEEDVKSKETKDTKEIFPSGSQASLQNIKSI